MRPFAPLAASILLCTASPALADNLESLALCTVKIFTQIHRTRAWSGKSSGACRGAQVSVEKGPDRVVVVASKLERVPEGWARVSFSAPQQYDELARPADHSAANRDIMARAKRLSNCLKLIRDGNEAPSCGSKGSRDVEAGEESGVTDTTVIWLDDDGRDTRVVYSVGDVAPTPSLPEELYNGEDEPLPAGTNIWIPIKQGDRGGN